jgi:hypothetical protein
MEYLVPEGLTDLQVLICNARLANHLTYKQIIAQFSTIVYEWRLADLIFKSATDFPYSFGSNGGRIPFLNPYDESLLINWISKKNAYCNTASTF